MTRAYATTDSFTRSRMVSVAPTPPRVGAVSFEGSITFTNRANKILFFFFNYFNRSSSSGRTHGLNRPTHISPGACLAFRYRGLDHDHQPSRTAPNLVK